ncbi:aldehyde dehydrogenase family protein (plasmid) [Citricoccus sp. SGAir0253]|uniref:benzaldehyde dehydrogenase n=1 Tax=Citricoccus sp. SGAir0253 TaxID=2567881 RepID=UPI0010CCDCEE|nr:benzaldehyde dehydrogenase [Citricoccus sp. SGAir0253]QCU79650.1 aldehyde dehydrogenase family protein [Citricoccus sp. SGAir0253]
MTITDTQPTSVLESSVWDGKIYTEAWTEGSAGSIDVLEPATGEVLGRAGMASAADVFAAATRAARAQKEWAAKRPEERAAVLRRAGQVFEDHADELNLWVQRETGAIAAKAALETHVAANECFDAAGLPHHPAGEVLTSDAEHWSFARRAPAGVVGVISPFNFPLILSIRSVAPALALGNAVILKPDPRTAVSGGVMIMRAFEEAGLPAGVLQLLPGGAEAGAALTEAPEVRVVSFTGSTAAGRKVGEACGRNLKRAHLELGGNNALVVLPGADVAAAASAGAFGSFLHQGQVCMTTGRHLVHESIKDEYVAALRAKAEHLPVGDPTGQVALGPVIDEGQRDNIDRLVKAAQDAGAILEAGGTYQDLFYAPTVLTGLDRENPAWAEEIFGPVAPVMGFSTLEEAAEIINANEYGLSVGILGDVGEAMKLADQVHSGKVHINEQTVGDESNAPFGGVGASGTGSRFGGYTANIEAFTETQWLTMRPDIAPYPF